MIRSLIDATGDGVAFAAGFAFLLVVNFGLAPFRAATLAGGAIARQRRRRRLERAAARLGVRQVGVAIRLDGPSGATVRRADAPTAH